MRFEVFILVMCLSLEVKNQYCSRNFSSINIIMRPDMLENLFAYRESQYLWLSS